MLKANPGALRHSSGVHGAHAQAVLHEEADRHLALPFGVRRTRLHADDMALLQLQLQRVLHRDDALGRADAERNRVKKRRLARPRAARDDDVLAERHTCVDKLHHVGAHRIEGDDLFEGEKRLAELSDREARAVRRDRRDHGVHAGAVHKTRVHERAGFVDAPPHLVDDALDHADEVAGVSEVAVGETHLALALHVDVPVVDDHDLRDRIVGDQRLQRSEAQHVLDRLAAEIVEHPLAEDPE